ncbi:hypothetical protein [Nocardia neocaledoniensis]|uniref:hypothetical protein n=1 Tax=Nocardia neocaledoniensis TaxID=236511 RepID=UPI0024547D83|nr:hypothetical protein [Nocardia neocaledoniensis]
MLAIIDRALIRIATHEFAAEYYDEFGTNEFGIDDTIRRICEHLPGLVGEHGHRAIRAEIDHVLSLHPEMLTATIAERAARHAIRTTEARRHIQAAENACTARQFGRARRLLADAETIDPAMNHQIHHHRARLAAAEEAARLIAS